MVLILMFFLFGTSIFKASCYPHEIEGSNNVGIYGGHEIPIENTPYMASVRMTIDETCSHGCGGTIIHEQYILTAAHCCWLPKMICKVVVGTNNITGEGGDAYDVEKIIKHEGFAFQTAEYDACVIKLTKPITFGPKVAKVTLATPSFKVPRTANLNITGWGLTETQNLSKVLHQVDVPKVPFDKCLEIYSGIDDEFLPNITTRMICAGKLGDGACHVRPGSDSGGPLTFGKVQVGITSFVSECGSKNPTVFTKVASVFCWIMEKTYFGN